MNVVFNTGRLYQAEGQVITATYDRPLGLILFKDHSRGICGEITNHFHINNEDELMRHTMHHYDRNRYHMSLRALEITRDPNIEPRRIRL